MKKIFLILILILVVISTIYSIDKSVVFNNDIMTISLKAGMKMLYGQTNEIVYNPEFTNGTYLSKLEWRQDATMIGGKLHFDFFDRIIINGSVYTNLGTRKGLMEDFDYLDNEKPTTWTHYSLSETEMEIQTYDLNLAVRTNKILGFLEFDGIFGMRNEQRYWTDALQSIIYSSNYTEEDGFRDIEQDLEDVPGINYDVSMIFPYAGAGIATTFNKLYMRIYGLYGIGDITAIDNHLLRGITFVDTFENVTYLETGIEMSWDFTEHTYFSLGGTYSMIPEGTVGDTLLWDGEFKQYHNDIAGFSQESITIDFGFGLEY